MPVVGQLGVFPIDYVAHPVSHVSTKLGALNDMGIPQMVDHYAQLIGTPEVKPVVVGHSFGGLIAQELLANGVVAAAVAIDPAAIKGVKALPFAQLKSAFPVLGNPANLHRTVSLTPKQFHYAFGNTLPEEESDALHGTWTIRRRSAAVSGRRSELLPALSGQGRHSPGRPRTAAAYLRNRRPHPSRSRSRRKCSTCTPRARPTPNSMSSKGRATPWPSTAAGKRSPRSP